MKVEQDLPQIAWDRATELLDDNPTVVGEAVGLSIKSKLKLLVATLRSEKERTPPIVDGLAVRGGECN